MVNAGNYTSSMDGMEYSLEITFLFGIGRCGASNCAFFPVRFHPAMQENVEEHHGWWGSDLEL